MFLSWLGSKTLLTSSFVAGLENHGSGVLESQTHSLQVSKFFIFAEKRLPILSNRSWYAIWLGSHNCKRVHRLF